MFYETILPFIIVISSFIVSLIITIPLQKSHKQSWDESEDNFDDIVEAFNYVGKIASEAGCSISEMVDAFNALATPSEETTETQEQKEPQVIFEPKVMFIEPQGQNPIMITDNIISIKQDDKEVDPFDDWYNNFMKEIEQ